jgi:hypothetical protein
MFSKLQQIPILNIVFIFLVAITSLYFIYKIAEGLFLNFFNGESKRTPKNDYDLEFLIQKQKMLLGGTGESSQVKKNNTSKTQTAYLELFKKTSDENVKKDLQLIFKILDCAQWGEGDFLQQVVLHLSKNKIKVTIIEVSKTLNMLLRTDSFLVFSPLPNSPKIMELVCVSLAYDALGTSGEAYALSKKIRGDDFRYVLKQINPQEFYKLDDFFSGLDNKIESLKILRPLDAKIAKNSQMAHSFFGTSEASSASEMKKKYNLVINLRHPDKIDTKKLSAKDMTLINDNFNIIQCAYELISKK